jgi:hypothetical protein
MRPFLSSFSPCSTKQRQVGRPDGTGKNTSLIIHNHDQRLFGIVIVRWEDLTAQGEL